MCIYNMLMFFFFTHAYSKIILVMLLEKVLCMNEHGVTCGSLTQKTYNTVSAKTRSCRIACEIYPVSPRMTSDLFSFDGFK